MIEVNYNLPGSSQPIQHIHQQNAPCTVCDIPTRARVIMIPAKTMCPSSWTREYYGYLMTDYDGHYKSSYTCLDVDPETIPGESGDTDPSVLYHTVTDCNGLLCPPYCHCVLPQISLPHSDVDYSFFTVYKLSIIVCIATVEPLLMDALNSRYLSLCTSRSSYSYK